MFQTVTSKLEKKNLNVNSVNDSFTYGHTHFEQWQTGGQVQKYSGWTSHK